MKKTIVVVGAGRGLGNGVAEKFGGNDFRVILMARSEGHLKEYATDFAAKGIEVYTQTADVADLAVIFLTPPRCTPISKTRSLWARR